MLSPVKKVSPSQIKKFKVEYYGGCARRWYIYKILKIREPSGEAAEYGGVVHEELEDYVQHGTPPTTPEAKLGIQSLHDEMDIWGIEVMIDEYELEVVDGVKFSGIIDLLYIDNGLPVVRDWKTRSKNSFASAPSNLSKDIQMMIYAWAGMHIFDCREIRIEHVNLRRENSGGVAMKIVEDVVRYDEVRDYLAREVAPAVRDMVEMSLWDVEEVPPCRDSCWAYNQRCFYADPRPEHAFIGCDNITFDNNKHVLYNGPSKTGFEPTEASVNLDELMNIGGAKPEPTPTPEPEPAPEPEPTRTVSPNPAGRLDGMSDLDSLKYYYEKDPGDPTIAAILQDVGHETKIEFSKWRAAQTEGNPVVMPDQAIDMPPLPL